MLFTALCFNLENSVRLLSGRDLQVAWGTLKMLAYRGLWRNF